MLSKSLQWSVSLSKRYQNKERVHIEKINILFSFNNNVWTHLWSRRTRSTLATLRSNTRDKLTLYCLWNWNNHIIKTWYHVLQLLSFTSYPLGPGGPSGPGEPGGPATPCYMSIHGIVIQIDSATLNVFKASKQKFVLFFSRSFSLSRQLTGSPGTPGYPTDPCSPKRFVEITSPGSPCRWTVDIVIHEKIPIFLQLLSILSICNQVQSI